MSNLLLNNFIIALIGFFCEYRVFYPQLMVSRRGDNRLQVEFRTP